MSKRKCSPIPIFVAIPNQGSVTISVANMMVDIVTHCITTKKYEPTVRYSQLCGIDHNRNKIVTEFLKTDCKWLLMMDDDNAPLNNPLDLIAFNKDVIVCPTLMYKGDKMAYNVFKQHDKGLITMLYTGGRKLVRIDRGGTGCILIKREVLEGMKRPFESIINKETGERVMGEDLAFCEKVEQKGFKLWTHWGYSCSHYKTIDLNKIAKLVLKQVTKKV